MKECCWKPPELVLGLQHGEGGGCGAKLTLCFTLFYTVKADLDCCRQESRAESATRGAQCMREDTSKQWGQLDWPCPTPTTLPCSTSTAHELARHISKACFNLMCWYESYQPESQQESNATVFPPLSILKTWWNASRVHRWFKFTASLRRFLFIWLSDQVEPFEILDGGGELAKQMSVPELNHRNNLRSKNSSLVSDFESNAPWLCKPLTMCFYGIVASIAKSTSGRSCRRKRKADLLLLTEEDS